MIASSFCYTTKACWFFALLAIMMLLSFTASLLLGSAPIGIEQQLNTLFAFWQGKTEVDNGNTFLLILQLRLNRSMAAFCCGAMLALAGVLMQVLLRNPLAEPYILGISGGAASFALITMLAGLRGLWTGSAAFAGACLSVFLVFVFSYRQGQWQIIRLLLTGVILGTGWSALISFLLIISHADQVHGMLFWLMGEIGYQNHLLFPYVLLLVSVFVMYFFAVRLNLLSWGETHAAMLGVNTAYLRGLIFFLASLLTATSVSMIGSIGFIGLIVPHILRLQIGSDHRLLIPAAVLAGGSFLLLADTLSRTVLAPQQLPVGIITAFIGVPLFLYLLARQAQITS